MTEPVLLSSQSGKILTLTLNRPEVHNAMDSALCRALIDALQQADHDESVNVVVICGAGRSFCAGADTNEFKHLTPEQRANVRDRAGLSAGIHTTLARMQTPVIAAVHGHALGGGCGLALGCDLVVAHEGASFGYPEIRHHLVAAVVMANLTRQIGRKAAMDLVLTGRRISAREALQLGMINRLHDDASFEQGVRELAETVAGHYRGALRLTKHLFNTVAEMDLISGIERGRLANEEMRSLRAAAGTN
ncbi:enoyl-CoA hydratase/isomerase family protein [Daeguia caeni]|uniref:Enoyl-CoA hydratase/isomerase family protein n=1 Tax=Daeguia caeni TaxID=439612 RepID=A0ABV9H704_9HYPH